MRALFKGAQVYRDNQFHLTDVIVHDGIIISISPDLPTDSVDSVFFLDGCYLAPSFCDLHVHLREPGFGYKETIADGTKAAAAGGFTTVCAMPNLDPVPDCLEHLEQELKIIRQDACIEVLPYAAITQGRRGGGAPVDFAALAPRVCAFSDDGTGVQQRADMLAAMRLAKAHSAIITAHCEDESLIPAGGCAHDGLLVEKYGLIGIPAESEWKQIARDIELVRQTGVQYHVCHLSARESVELIRKAKAEGLPVSCEVTPHNLTLTDADLLDEGRFKMNPPIRSAEHRQALLEGFLDGTIDVMATDHAPHASEEKAKGLVGSTMGVVGLETAFSVLYTHLVKTGLMSFEALVDRLSAAPRKLFGLAPVSIEVDQAFNAVALDLDKTYTVDPETFLTKGRATPFDGITLQGQVQATWHKGSLVYKRED